MVQRYDMTELGREYMRYTEMVEDLEGVYVTYDDYQKLEAELEQLRQQVKAPADDGWIEWAGGECPVRADAIVDVKWSGGNQSDFGKAYYWSWEHYDYDDNIIAYRVVKP